MVKHCPTCDRSSETVRFLGEFCEVCVADGIKKGMADSVKAERCKSCGRLRASWGYAQLDKSSMEDVIRRSLGTKCGVHVDRFDSSGADVRFRCEVEGGTAVFGKRIRILVKDTMCTDCYRKTSGYYEAIVQLRGPEGQVDRMMKRLFSFIEARGGFVSRVEELEEGYNIYVSDKKAAGNFFHLNKLKPKRSFTLYGITRGNKVYRNVYLLRLDSL